MAESTDPVRAGLDSFFRASGTLTAAALVLSIAMVVIPFFVCCAPSFFLGIIGAALDGRTALDERLDTGEEFELAETPAPSE